MYLFYHFNFERTYKVKESKESMCFVEQKYKPEQKQNGIENVKSHTQF